MKRYIKSETTITPAFQKRCDECKAIVDKAYNPDTEDFYVEQFGDTVYEETVADSKGRSHDWAIDKAWLTYAESWDEDDNRVKRGSKVPGSVHYEISVDGDSADEVTYAFKTLEDAKKYMKYLQEE